MNTYDSQALGSYTLFKYFVYYNYFFPTIIIFFPCDPTGVVLMENSTLSYLYLISEISWIFNGINATWLNLENIEIFIRNLEAEVKMNVLGRFITQCLGQELEFCIFLSVNHWFIFGKGQWNLCCPWVKVSQFSQVSNWFFKLNFIKTPWFMIYGVIQSWVSALSFIPQH